MSFVTMAIAEEGSTQMDKSWGGGQEQTSALSAVHQLVGYPMRMPDRVTLGSVVLHMENILLNMVMSAVVRAITPVNDRGHKSTSIPGSFGLLSARSGCCSRIKPPHMHLLLSKASEGATLSLMWSTL